MTRNDVILQLFRCVRDALTTIQHCERQGNKVIYYDKSKKVTVSFRIKIEDAPAARLEDYMP